jgi:hypothetical protein
MDDLMFIGYINKILPFFDHQRVLFGAFTVT